MTGNDYSAVACSAFTAGKKKPGCSRASFGANAMSSLHLKKAQQPEGGARQLPYAEWVEINPQQAALYLLMNTLNRPKKPQKIALYTADMKAGKWPITGATICLGKSGRLLDGQNRLQAIVDSGVTVWMLVVTGLDDDIFDVIDGGARRTASDVLVIEGYEGWVASCGATAASVAMNLASGKSPYSMKWTPNSIRRFVSDYPGLMHSVQFLESVPRRPAPLPHSAAAALHFFMAREDSMLADMLLTQLYRGDNMTADDMVLKLRNTLLGRVQQKLTSSLHYTAAMGAVVKVWNAKRAGRTIAHINNAFPRTGEDFPAIK